MTRGKANISLKNNAEVLTGQLFGTEQVESNDCAKTGFSKKKLP
jgi:hypothetical protein